MAVAGSGLDDGFAGLWADRPEGYRAGAYAVGALVAIGIHLTVGVALSRLDLSALFRRDANIEIDVAERPPPPPDVRPEPPPPPPPPPDPHPRLVARRTPVAPPPAAPPPPNQEPPPRAGEAPPVFGVTMDSVVAGDSAGMAVPVGNTLMTKERKRPKPSEVVQPLAGDTNRLPTPVPEVFVAQRPEVLREVKADYPPDAQRMGLEGHVMTKLLIDESGEVRDVKIITPAGHGFDEQARQALRRFKFSPARTSDGKAVPTSIVYKYTFELPQ